MLGVDKSSPNAAATAPHTRLRVCLVAAVAALVGLAGTLPHLFFASDLGEFALFEGAWDESFYALVLGGDFVNWNPYPARALSGLLLSAAGGSNYLFALLSDVLWPALAVLAAGFVALTITRGWLFVVLVLFILVFAGDILALNSSIVHSQDLTISYALRALDPEVRQFFSDPFVTFLYIYRTPEPQLSLPVFFLFVALTIRFLKQGEPRKRDWILIFIATFACMHIYTFFAAASLIVAGIGAASLLLVRRWWAAAGLGCMTALCALYLGWRLTLSHVGEAEATIFSSSLPLFAPSMVYGAALAFVFTWIFRKDLRSDPLLVFCLLCYFVPFITLNQQVFTGVMVQTLNWERYIHYPLIAISTCVLLGRLDWRPLGARIRHRVHGMPAASRHGSVALIVLSLGLVGAFLIYAQLKTYRQFAHYNLTTIAYAKLIDYIHTTHHNAPSRITLDHPSYDAAVHARASTSGLELRGYSDLLKSLKQSQAASDPSSPSHSSQWGFEHAARLGLTPDQYYAELLTEIDNRACWPHLMFHFSFLECAPYVSDFRTYSPSRLKEAVPSIAASYERYLHATPDKDARAAEAILLSTEPVRGETVILWSHEPAGTIQLATPENGFAPARSVEVFAYWQRPK